MGNHTTRPTAGTGTLATRNPQHQERHTPRKHTPNRRKPPHVRGHGTPTSPSRTNLHTTATQKKEGPPGRDRQSCGNHAQNTLFSHEIIRNRCRRFSRLTNSPTGQKQAARFLQKHRSLQTFRSGGSGWHPNQPQWELPSQDSKVLETSALKKCSASGPLLLRGLYFLVGLPGLQVSSQ